MNYWAKRQAEIQEKLLNKSQKQINKQLSKYYATAAKKVIEDFENTYNKLLATIEDGKEPTPADLYKLDRYWKMQGQLRQELRKLGEKQISLLTKQFEISFFDIYYSIAIEGKEAFNTIDSAGALALINAAWLADGKNFSQRIWENTEKLVESLNEQLINIVATGKKTTELKNLLQERFGVSYSRANTLVRTELAHIQTVAAKERYESYGLTKYEILGNDDDSCGNHSVDCHDMDGKTFLYTEMSTGVNAPPFHPNCKCAIIPVID
jgi:SPP1 gp7 family putative phage head morphogenesis protein